MSLVTKQKIFFNKYKIKKLIASTGNSIVYEGINLKDNTPIAMKFEYNVALNKLLETELYILYNIRGFGIPKIISFGKIEYYDILIEELLGLSLYNILDKKKVPSNEEKLKSVCMLALQILDRLEHIHSKNIVHRDINPNNLLLGRSDQNIIYLIDYNFSCKYRSTRTGKHVKYKNAKVSVGSLKFASLKANKGFIQSRRDDLESLGYLLIFLAVGSLPWSFIDEEKDPYKRYEKTVKMKESIEPEKLCKGLCKEFLEYIKYSKKLGFEDEPDYNYLRNLFTTILTRNDQKNDMNFYWILNKKIVSDIEQKLIYKKNDETKKKKSSAEIRLYNQIKKKLENKNNFEENKINDINEINISNDNDDNNYNLKNRNNVNNFDLINNKLNIKKNDIKETSDIKNNKIEIDNQNNVIINDENNIKDL